MTTQTIVPRGRSGRSWWGSRTTSLVNASYFYVFGKTGAPRIAASGTEGEWRREAGVAEPQVGATEGAMA